MIWIEIVTIAVILVFAFAISLSAIFSIFEKNFFGEIINKFVYLLIVIYALICMVFFLIGNMGGQNV